MLLQVPFRFLFPSSFLDLFQKGGSEERSNRPQRSHVHQMISIGSPLGALRTSRVHPGCIPER